jgi:tRNA dimethylallyltransferase
LQTLHRPQLPIDMHRSAANPAEQHPPVPLRLDARRLLVYNVAVIDLSSLRPAESLVVLVGPTGAGKTALAIRLAHCYGGEIVSADSRQVYRYMSIGTAKPTPAEQQTARHHLIDVVDPDESFTLADYQSAARAAIGDIQSRGRLPLLVGGTGLYIRAVTEGLNVPAVPPNEPLRAQLSGQLQRLGLDWLVDQVRRVDPVTANRESANPRRLIRALEVHQSTGRPLSELQTRTPPPYQQVWLGLTAERQELYRRVDDRVDDMIAAGLLDEVRRLVVMGYSWDLPSMSSLGYRQIGEHLRGECDLPSAIQSIKHATHAFVRHQYNWFRLSDPRIQWLHAGTSISLDNGV